jgi:hypothetical protein
MILGFHASNPLLLTRTFGNAASCQTCRRVPLCMKAKGRKGPSSSKSKPKAVEVASGTSKERSGVGFTVNSKSKVETSSDEVVKERVSGSAGDATPHRAFSPTGRAVLENPLRAADSETSAEETTDDLSAPVVDLTKLVANPELRWKWDVSPDAIVEQLAAARTNDYLETCIVSNRDHISERALYRFTSAILQAESQGAREEASNMRSLRADIIRICWEYDRPLRERLYDAEARLVKVLKNEEEANILKLISRECGNTSIDANAFWIVTFAAVAAWEAQNDADRNQYSEVQLRLKEIAEATWKCDKLLKLLSPSLSLVGQVLTASDPERQAEVLLGASEALILEMGLILEQIRLWPSNAYGEFIQKMQDIRDYAIENVLGCLVPSFESFRFTPPDIDRGSRLIEFQTRNAGRKI